MAARKQAPEAPAATPARATGARKKAAPAKKAATTTTKAAPVKTSAAKTSVAKTAAAKTGSTPAHAPAKKAAANGTAHQAATKTATRAPARKAPVSKGAGAARRLAVREDESPWTADELAQVRAELTANIERLVAELNEMERDLAGLIRDSGDGAGDDQADAGTKNFATDYEYTVARQARESLLQSRHALERIDNGTYGICESCGKPIGKLRLQAFPRATLCLQCKQQSERR